MGGLMKEFLESVVSAGFDPNRGLFAATPDGQAYPNPLAGGHTEGGWGCYVWVAVVTSVA